MTAQPTATRANVAALIPSYFEEKHIREVASATRAQLDLVLVVDDGSTDRTSDEARAAGVEVIRHEKNAGKGAAIKTGLRALLDRAAVEFILILDGDGQHLPSEIPNFLTESNATGAPLNSVAEIRAELAHHVENPVNWTMSVQRMGATVHYPEAQWCTDNGAMIAMAAGMRLQKGIEQAHTSYAFDVLPRWPLAQQ